MNKVQLFRKTQKRDFFAHHMLLHVADLEIKEAENSKTGRFNKCLASIVLSTLAIEALLNAVGSRIEPDWESFEKKNPTEKLNSLTENLSINYDSSTEPWSAILHLMRLRNDIAHPKPEPLSEEKILPEVGLKNEWFKFPRSKFERQITLGYAQRAYKAVSTLKQILHDHMPEDMRFGIYTDMWSGSTKLID